MKLAIILIIMSSTAYGCIATVDQADPTCDAGTDVDADAEACHTPGGCLIGPIACETDADCGIGVCDPESKVCQAPDDDRCNGVPSGVPATPQLLGPCIVERCTAEGETVPTNAPAGTPCDGGTCADGECVLE